MFKLLQMLLTTLLVSFYFFPFEFTFLPGVNTKMILAAIGLFILLLVMIKKPDFNIPKQLLILFVIASLVSLTSLFSVTFNQTEDTSYVGYVVSAAVWLSGAFTSCVAIKLVHGRIDVKLVVDYLLAVSVFQCISAMLIEYVPNVKEIVDTYVEQGQVFMDKVNRLYGIGAALDVAGSRFSAVLVALAVVVLGRRHNLSVGSLVIYSSSFIVITIVGNMIARTTIIGSAIGLFYFLIMMIVPSFQTSTSKSRIFWVTTMATVTLVPIAIFLYRMFPSVKDLMRFAFEGFFSLVEEGRWEVDSNQTLQSMVVFPETLKTWLFGDGYFLNSRYDINYLGDATTAGYYMGTDIGYLRFLFYFGIIGTIAMVSMIVYSAKACIALLPEYKIVFLLILAVGLIAWLKSSTDVFLCFALFLCVGLMRYKENEKTII